MNRIVRCLGCLGCAARGIGLASCLLAGCGHDSAAPANDLATPVDASEPAAPPDMAASVIADLAPVLPDLLAERAIYASSATTLYRFDPGTRALMTVADFSCKAEKMQNLAVDKDENLFGVTLVSLVTIDKANGNCWRIAKGPYPRSLAFVPAGVLDANDEVLVGYDGAQYLRIDPKTGDISFAGSLNTPNMVDPQYGISGDVVAMPGGMTAFASVIEYAVPKHNDVLLFVDAKTGRGMMPLVATQQPSLFGLAQWGGQIYAFSSRGTILQIDANSAAVSIAWPDPGGDGGAPGDAGPAIAFTGAGVTTRAP